MLGLAGFLLVRITFSHRSSFALLCTPFLLFLSRSRLRRGWRSARLEEEEEEREEEEQEQEEQEEEEKEEEKGTRLRW